MSQLHLAGLRFLDKNETKCNNLLLPSIERNLLLT